MEIRSDGQKGLSYVELGRKYHMDPRTAKRYTESPQKPEYPLREPKPTKMAPYKQIVDEWLEEAPYSALRILEKLREMGFEGGYSSVKAYVSSRKMDLNEKATVRFETMPGKAESDGLRILRGSPGVRGREEEEAVLLSHDSGVFANAVH